MSRFCAAPVFGNGMVLQRDADIVIWGGGDGSEVTVSLAGSSAKCVPKNGTWRCGFPPLHSGSGLTLRIVQGDAVLAFSDLSMGDVWLAAGQSNMEFFLRYEKHWSEAASGERNRSIRMYTCPRIAFSGQEVYQSDVGKWFGEGDARWEWFSAVGYWFARYIQPVLGVPIGIVSCNWGGTSASAWLPADSLKDAPLNVYLKDYSDASAAISAEECRAKSSDGWALQKDEAHKADWAKVMYGLDRGQQLERMARCANNPVVPMGPYNKNRPGCLYENMLSPLFPLSMKGVLWYQGENDVQHAELYSELFERMISAWREGFGKQLPFFFVQLAPFERWMALDGRAFPEIRRQQDRVSRECRGCYMTSTGDIGDRYDIHPKEKKEIGRRLALLAEEKAYGIDVCGEPPELRRAEQLDGRSIRLAFSGAGDGMILDGIRINGLTLMGKGGEIPVAEARAERDSVVVKCGETPRGAMRIDFAQQPYEKVNLCNSSRIPAKPFTTTMIWDEGG